MVDVMVRESATEVGSCAYLAGFFDGEGSIGLAKSRTGKVGPYHYELRIAVAQVNPSPLYKFADLFGGSVHKQFPKKPHLGSKPLYKWGVSSDKAYRALVAMLPYLDVKYEEAKIGIKFQESKLPKWTRLTDKERLRHEALYLQLRSLKQRTF